MYLTLKPHPFSMDTGVFPVRAGTIDRMLREAAGGQYRKALAVSVNGYDVPRSWWSKITPKDGTVVHVTVMPEGDSAKKVLRTVALVALAVFAQPLAGMALGAMGIGATATAMAIATAAISLVGSLAINALLPPPKPASAPGGTEGSLFSLSSSQNVADPYGCIPVIFGEMRVFPRYASMAFSATTGQTQYQYMLFDLGYGDIDVDRVIATAKLGETPLSNFEHEIEVSKNPKLFKDDIAEVPVSATINDGMTVTRTTPAGVERISLDLAFPQGLFGADKKGNIKQATAGIGITYRKLPSGSPVTLPMPGTMHNGAPVTASGMRAGTGNFHISTTDRKPFYAGIEWAVEAGQYEVTVTRSATDWKGAEENSRAGDAQWTVIRGIKNKPASTTNTWKVALKVKATQQFNGAMEAFNCEVAQRYRAWNGTTWTPPALSVSPAWALAWMLTECEDIPVGDRLDESELDLASFKSAAEWFQANEYGVRGIVDSRQTVRQVIDDILACANARLSLTDGKVGILLDKGDQIAVGAFHPKNMSGFNGSRAFTKLPHALRMKFKNPENGWQVDEIVVPMDGYSWRGKDRRGNTSSAPPATEFESVDLRFAAYAEQAWRVASMMQAQGIYRPNVYGFQTDHANLRFTRGDLVTCQHTLVDWGVGVGTIVAVGTNSFSLDETIFTEAGKTYSARIIHADGQESVVDVTPTGTETRTFTATHTAQKGDVVLLGESEKQLTKLLITGIYPGANLSAEITGVEFAPEVYSYIANPPAQIQSELTGVTYLDKPPAPNISIVLSDPVNSTPDDSGVTEPEVHVVVQQPPRYEKPRMLHDNRAER